MKNSSLGDVTNLSASDCSLPLAHCISLMAVNSVGAVVGTFGNFLVCIAVLYTSPRLRRCSNYLLVSLAIADLIVTVVCEPLVVGIAAKKTFFNDCASNLRLAYVVSSNFSCAASVLHLAAISVDRFLAVIFPLRHGRIMKSYGLKVMLIVVWGTSTVFAFLRVPFLKETNCGCCDVYNKLFPHHRMLRVNHDFGIFAQEEKETRTGIDARQNINFRQEQS